MQDRSVCVEARQGNVTSATCLQVLVLFHIDDFMLAGRTGEAGWEEFQRRMHNKPGNGPSEERGHLRMTGVDAS